MSDPPTPTKKTPIGLILLSSVLAFILGALLSTVFLKKPAENVTENVEEITEDSPTPPAPLPPQDQDPLQVSPTRVHGKTVTDVRKLSKGFDFKSTVDFPAGGLASKVRSSSETYLAEYSLKVTSPKPAKSVEEVTEVDSTLSDALPDLATMLETATVNPYWHELYERKQKTVINDAHYLNELITKHNFYDCQTMLNLRHPESNRRALLVQADMDVVTDGSDGDRMPTMPEEITTATYYQPTTSYSWEKTTDIPNPMIAGYRTRIGNADRELAQSSTSAERKTWLRDRKKMLNAKIDEMKRRSFLIAEHDPFIVLPVPVIVAKDTYSANVGDYAVVFHKGKAYPAIVGDAGPSYKMGEASLRIAKEIDSRSGSNWRPVSDLSVTYLVFPGTRKKPHRAPDYDDIYQECTRLLDEVGGLGSSFTLRKWENTLAPETTDSAADSEESE